MKKITFLAALFLSANAFSQTVLFNYEDVIPSFEFCFDATDPDECSQGRVANNDQNGANTTAMTFQGQTGTTGGDFSNGFGIELASATTLNASGTFFTILFRSDNNPTGDLSIQAQFINNPDAGGSIRGELFGSYTMTDGSWQKIELAADPANFQGGFDGSTSFSRVNFFVAQGAANGYVYGFDEGTLNSVSLSSNEFYKRNVKVYPSPARDSINVDGRIKGNMIKIINVMGQTMSETKIDGKFNTVDTSSLSNGMYFLKLDGGSSYQFVKK